MECYPIDAIQKALAEHLCSASLTSEDRSGGNGAAAGSCLDHTWHCWARNSKVSANRALPDSNETLVDGETVASGLAEQANAKTHTRSVTRLH